MACISAMALVFASKAVLVCCVFLNCSGEPPQDAGREHAIHSKEQGEAKCENKHGADDKPSFGLWW